jgi:hypothetical protein
VFNTVAEHNNKYTPLDLLDGTGRIHNFCSLYYEQLLVIAGKVLVAVVGCRRYISISV